MARKQTVGELVYKITGDSKGLGASLAKSEAQVKGLGGVFGGLNKKSVAALAGVGIGVAALGATLVSATKRAAAFDTQIGNLRTLIGDDEAGIADLRKGILDLTKSIPRSADELGAAAYDILSAGITDSAEALQVLEVSGKLAVAGLGSTKEAVNLTTSAMNAFSIDAANAEAIANTVFLTVRAGKTTVAELAQSFGNVAAAAQGAGVSFEETQAATAALTVVGFRTATAQDRLRALFDEMTRSSGKLADGIKEVGIENVGATIKSDGFKSVLDELFDSVNGDTLAFKNMFSSVEAGGAALALVTGASDTYNDTLKDMTSGLAVLSQAFEDQAETAESQYQLAMNNINVLLTELGSKILPSVVRGLAFLNDAFDVVFGDPTQDAVRQMNTEIKKSNGLIQTYKENMLEAEEAGDDNAVALNKNATQYEKLRRQMNEANKEVLDYNNKLRDIKHEFGSATKDASAFTVVGASLVDVYKQGKEAISDVSGETGAYEDALAAAEARAKSATDALHKLNNDEIKTLRSETLGAAEDLHEMANELGSSDKASEEAEKAMEKARTELEKFQGSMVDFIDSSREASKVLNEELTKSFNEFGESLTSNVKDTRQKLAQIVIGAEQEVADLTKRISEEDNQDRKKKLQEQLAEQKKILDSRVGFEERQAEAIAEIRSRLEEAGINVEDAGLEGLTDVRSLEEEIEEARRLASLNEFQLFEEQQLNKLTRLADDFILEVELSRSKIEKQKEFEAELTKFLLDTTVVRVEAVDEWATKTIKSHDEVASSLQRLISLQSQVGSVGSSNLDPYSAGGYVGASGGEVHAGEYVIPANLVGRLGGLVSQLEKERTGGDVDNSRNVNAPITINQAEDGFDADTLAQVLGFELSSL